MQDSQFNQIKYDNLLEKLRFSINQSDIFMSNKYFDIIIDLKSKGLRSTHLGFVYSYMYLQTYMCRNTTYDHYIPSVTEIKEILGYSPIQKTVDYIIKKNGLLDKERLTITDNNFPIINQYIKENGSLEFDLVLDIHDSLKDHRDMYNIANTTKYKYPVLSFYDDHSRDDVEVSYFDNGGTFYDTSNTTNIRFEVFAHCMSHSILGDTGFYLYSYIKHMNDLFGEEYKATALTISKKTGIPERTVKKYLKILKTYNLIYTEHNMEYFSLGMDDEYRKASSHHIIPFEQFSEYPIDYEKLPMKTRAEHFKIIKEEERKIDIKFDL